MNINNVYFNLYLLIIISYIEGKYAVSAGWLLSLASIGIQSS